MGLSSNHVLLIAIALLVLLPGKANAFGAGIQAHLVQLAQDTD
jgi:hypothetical protein